MREVSTDPILFTVPMMELQFSYVGSPGKKCNLPHISLLFADCRSSYVLGNKGRTLQTSGGNLRSYVTGQIGI